MRQLEEKEISQAVIRRLPRYYRYLGELLENGVERISSNDLSRRMKVTASQIRQDLNNFGGFGQQGYGYNVKYLYTEIGKILGLEEDHNMIIIGAGNLGQALSNYAAFEKRGFILKGIFDVNHEGDCSRTAMTACALAKALGLKSAVAGTTDHMVYYIQVDGKAYFGQNNTLNLDFPTPDNVYFQ